METEVDRIEHDLSNDELEELIRLAPRGCRFAYVSVRPATPDRAYIDAPAFTHNGEKITAIESGCMRIRHDRSDEKRYPTTTQIVRSIYEALHSIHERRKASAAKSVETRRRRDALKLYRVAEQWMQHVVDPREACRVCGRGFTDPESRARGIGPECIEHVVAVANAIAVSMTNKGHALPQTQAAIVAYVRGVLQPEQQQDAA